MGSRRRDCRIDNGLVGAGSSTARGGHGALWIRQTC